ncbi:leucine-rich repeat-containing protein 19-like [Mastacembelus armatus]|uniref:Leucine-rich repeat-containing protein 19-like n=1 Tax=Mastacembelus armatus TaxID=205130 RepID=A0A3Q3N6W9_9TELE|nr:leucine-rich repeat-containing protein 19-like [Mastacembelus armatus]
MEKCLQPLPLLCLTALIVMNIIEAVEVDAPEKTNQLLKAIPYCGNCSSVTKLMIEKNLITLDETDRLALASYPTLVELHLDGNLVTSIPARYFSVIPHLRVLSLSRNTISSLHPEAFSDLYALKKLDLSHNLLTSLPAQLFRGLSHLQTLHLQENPWNCSCPLLNSIAEIKAQHVTTGGPPATCVSPEKQDGNDLLNATAVCYPSPPYTVTTEPQKPVDSQELFSTSTTLKTTIQNHNITKDHILVLGNTWKFTVCVAALALTTFILIVCAIKGPSWYKLLHNYRHQQLNQENDEEKDIASKALSKTGTHQTFTFRQIEQIEEEDEEDEYFEDPYIKRKE